MTSDEQNFFEIKGVSKNFGDVVAVDNVDLTIKKGELFSILGASGSGKTTLLRILAGLEIPSQGSILIDGVDMTSVAPYDRPVNIMFQNYALFPHMSVFENIAYGLKKEGLKKESIEEVIIATSATVEGQTTAYYIQDSLKNLDVKITKLAQGLPVGGEIESLDDGTLFSAFKNRSNLVSNSD